jgi:hypothetical protein
MRIISRLQGVITDLIFEDAFSDFCKLTLIPFNIILNPLLHVGNIRLRGQDKSVIVELDPLLVEIVNFTTEMRKVAENQW